MRLRDGTALLGTVCNTTPNAVPYALWFAANDGEYLVDLSDVLGRPGDSGLTGIACHGDRIYVAVQSTEAARILVLDRHLVPVDVVASPDFMDIHSLHISGDSLLVCSTGRQAVIRVDVGEHRATMLCEFDAPIHLNSACFDGPALLVCCHYPGRVVPQASGGGVIDATERRVVLAGLEQPHSLKPWDSGFLVLDSDRRKLIRFDHSGIRGQQDLGGFLRGIAATAESMFVASSAGRVISRKNPQVPPGRQFWQAVAEPVRIHELDAKTLAVKAEHFPLVAGFEIYELMALESTWGIDPAPDRLIPADANALSRAFYEAAKRALAELYQRRR